MNWRIVLWALSVVMPLAIPEVILAKPSWATDNSNSCREGCHTNVLNGQMAVTGEDLMVDLGTQLDGKTRGLLKTFLVEPGEVASLSATVLFGDSKYALQLKRLETAGQANSAENLLDWSAANDGGNVWLRQEDDSPAYFTKGEGSNDGIEWDDEEVTYTFDLMVGADTPPDFYDLEFAIAGKSFSDGLWYQDEHFYLRVLSNLLGDMDGNGVLDAFDVDDFEQALADKQGYIDTHPGMDPDKLGDFDASGGLDAFDVDDFEAALAGGASVPEPATVCLLAIAGVLVCRRRAT